MLRLPIGGDLLIEGRAVGAVGLVDLIYFFFFCVTFIADAPFVKLAVATTFSLTFLGFLASRLPRLLSPFDI